MPDTAQPELIDVVGRFDAEQEIPERMRADVRLLGELLGQVLRESGSPGLFEDVERLRVATIQAECLVFGSQFDTWRAAIDLLRLTDQNPDRRSDRVIDQQQRYR